VNGMYPELESLSLVELEARFRAASQEDPYLWYDEVAIAIRKRDPDAGARFLRGEVAGADTPRLTAVLLAITWFDERDRGQADLLIECLEHPDEAVVAGAINGLAGLGGCGLTERILALVVDSREMVRGAVVRFASRVVPDRAPALLLDALQDPHYLVRWNAVDELGELDYTAALARIEALSEDPDPHVRQAVLSVITSLGAPGRAVPFLLDALNDPHHLVREQAVQELDELEHTAALPSIEALCTDPHPDVREAALAAIDKLGAPDTAIRLLVDALHDPDATVRLTALSHLDRLEQFTDRATFERMLDDPDEDVRERAQSILDNEAP
jgi:HEAT repeat protein